MIEMPYTIELLNGRGEPTTFTIRKANMDDFDTFMELQDINIPTETTPLVARIAFCRGPIGESVEFFLDRTR